MNAAAKIIRKRVVYPPYKKTNHCPANISSEYKMLNNKYGKVKKKPLTQRIKSL